MTRIPLLTDEEMRQLESGHNPRTTKRKKAKTKPSETEEQLVLRATQAIAARGNEPLNFQTELASLIQMIALMQLALKHPGISDTMYHNGYKGCRELVQQVDPGHGPIWRLLMRGFEDRVIGFQGKP